VAAGQRGEQIEVAGEVIPEPCGRGLSHGGLLLLLLVVLMVMVKH